MLTQRWPGYLGFCPATFSTSSSRMFPSLAHRPWQVLCRVSLQHRSPLPQRSFRFPQPCHGELAPRGALPANLCSDPTLNLGWPVTTLCCTGCQSGGIHSFWFSLPDARVASLGLGKVQYYSSSDNNKDGPPKSAPGRAPSSEKVVSAAAKVTAGAQGTPKPITILCGSWWDVWYELQLFYCSILNVHTQYTHSITNIYIFKSYIWYRSLEIREVNGQYCTVYNILFFLFELIWIFCVAKL